MESKQKSKVNPERKRQRFSAEFMSEVYFGDTARQPLLIEQLSGQAGSDFQILRHKFPD